MAGIQKICGVCSCEFEPRFSYQMEERSVLDQAGRPRASFSFFCSQACLHKSHAEGESGLITCDACATSFHVELASQVLFVGKQRHYACSSDCRQQILDEARGLSLGEIHARSAAQAPAEAIPTAVASAASNAVNPTFDDPDLPPVLSPSLRPPAPERSPDIRSEHSGDRSPEAARASASGQVIPLAPPRGAAPAAQPTREPGGPRILAVFNHKGGTGKTTTSVTLAAGLAEQGAKVLLVDTDAQGNVGVSLGLTAERSLYHVLVMGLAIQDAVQTVRPNLDVLPSNETLAAAELYLAGRRQRDQVLSARLQGARDLYDYVIVDCSPSLSLMNQNALVLSDAVLCPVACDYLSLVGVRQVLRTIKHVNKLLGHPVQLWGVLPTFFDSRARICHEALDTLREHFRDRCFEPVRSAIKVKEAPAQGKTLFEYAPGSSAATDYLKVVTRLLEETTGASRAPASRQAAPRQAANNAEATQSARSIDQAVRAAGANVIGASVALPA